MRDPAAPGIAKTWDQPGSSSFKLHDRPTASAREVLQEDLLRAAGVKRGAAGRERPLQQVGRALGAAAWSSRPQPGDAGPARRGGDLTPSQQVPLCTSDFRFYGRRAVAFPFPVPFTTNRAALWADPRRDAETQPRPRFPEPLSRSGKLEAQSTDPHGTHYTHSNHGRPGWDALCSGQGTLARATTAPQEAPRVQVLLCHPNAEGSLGHRPGNVSKGPLLRPDGA